MLRKIYRKEAIEYKKHHWKGKALLLAGIPAWLVALLSFAFLTILIATTILCSFTQRIDVRGEVITLPHSVNVYAPQQGFVISQYAKVGDIVVKGQPLYEIDISRNTTSGNVSASQIEVINEKIKASTKAVEEKLKAQGITGEEIFEHPEYKELVADLIDDKIVISNQAQEAAETTDEEVPAE